MNEYKWIGKQPEKLRLFTFKKEIPSDLKQDHYCEVRIDFGLYGIAYAVQDRTTGCLVGKDGLEIRVYSAHLVTPGLVMGLRDLATADGRAWANQWRSSLHDSIMDRLALCGSGLF